MVSLIEWVGGKDGADGRNGTESMFSAKIKNISFSSKVAFKLSNNTTQRETRKLINFHGKAN